jgi:hypothetical protein
VQHQWTYPGLGLTPNELREVEFIERAAQYFTAVKAEMTLGKGAVDKRKVVADGTGVVMATTAWLVFKRLGVELPATFKDPYLEPEKQRPLK